MAPPDYPPEVTPTAPLRPRPIYRPVSLLPDRLLADPRPRSREFRAPFRPKARRAFRATPPVLSGVCGALVRSGLLAASLLWAEPEARSPVLTQPGRGFGSGITARLYFASGYCGWAGETLDRRQPIGSRRLLLLRFGRWKYRLQRRRRGKLDTRGRTFRRGWAGGCGRHGFGPRY